jgi:hypothetical protein
LKWVLWLSWLRGANKSDAVMNELEEIEGWLGAGVDREVLGWRNSLKNGIEALYKIATSTALLYYIMK